ncbi:MAG TPA: APC family permease, partial [Methylomirabilota bacterium]|nr:APC family permease [Methylomirabilota bacterium]
SAAALVFFAFIGFDEVITLAEETTDPTRTVPRALLLALGISTLLYIGVAVAAVSVLGADALGTSPRPLADVIGHVLGARGATLVAAIAVVTTTNTTLLALTAASRVLYGMANAGAMPRALARVHPRFGTPRRALVVAALVASAFAAIGDFTVIAAVTDFAVYVVFLAVNATVILLRWTRPDLPRPFAVPGVGAKVPLVPVLGLASVMLMMTQLESVAVIVGMVLCGAGLVAAWLVRARRSSLRVRGGG